VDDKHEQFFGRHLAAAGDVNGDGFADVLIPACFAERNDRNEGIVFCYLGSKAGLGKNPAWSAESNHPHALFGWSVSAAGDVNGDRLGDVLVGAKNFENGQDKEGAAALYLGSRSGLQRTPSWVFESNRSVDQTGDQVVGLGDIDGDGFPDFAVSSPGYHEPPGSEDGALGRVRIFFGSANGFSGDTRSRFEKPVTKWAAEEWTRLSSTVRWIWVLGAAVGLFVAGLWTREAWRRRTIIWVEKREIEGRNDERARIARDLHDEVSPRLSRIAVITEMVARQGGRSDPVTMYAQELSASARDLRTAVEQLVGGLRYGPDSLSTLVEMVSRQTSSFCSGTALRCLEDVPIHLPDFQLPAAVQEQLLPCTREAMGNVLSHAKASQVTIRVRWDSPRLEFEIEDDGNGFDPGNCHRGDGLENMRRRMEQIGGTCEIRSQVGLGTKVKLAIELPQGNPMRPPALPPRNRGIPREGKGPILGRK
jgi:signal transduction histidine kinase